MKIYIGQADLLAPVKYLGPISEIWSGRSLSPGLLAALTEDRQTKVSFSV